MQEQQKHMIESYVASYNEFDIDTMLENLDEKVVFENISNGEVTLRTEGIKEFRNQAESAKQYFEKRKQTIRSWDYNNQNVIVEIDYEAILAIDLPNGMKPGDTLKLKGESEFEFHENKIVRITDKS